MCPIMIQFNPSDLNSECHSVYFYDMYQGPRADPGFSTRGCAINPLQPVSRARFRVPEALEFCMIPF